MDLRIRAAAVSDVGQIVALERKVEEAPHWAEADYQAIVDAGGGEEVRRCLLLAESEGQLKGFAVGKVVGLSGQPGSVVEAELESVAVAPEVRRSGVGRRLCGAVLEWFRDQGAGSVALEVRATSAGAVALYRGLGFREVGLRRGYYSAPVDDALLMRLDLADCGEMSLPAR